MKRLSFLLIAATTLAAFGYSDKGGLITMTTSAETVSFMLQGSEIATVDWGDGSEIETKKLVGRVWFKRAYSDTVPRTITIIGENITELYCGESCLGLKYVDLFSG